MKSSIYIKWSLLGFRDLQGNMNFFSIDLKANGGYHSEFDILWWKVYNNRLLWSWHYFRNTFRQFSHQTWVSIIHHSGYLWKSGAPKCVHSGPYRIRSRMIINMRTAMICRVSFPILQAIARRHAQLSIKACPNTWLPKTLALIQLHSNIIQPFEPW